MQSPRPTSTRLLQGGIPWGVAPGCWQEVSNSRSHGYHKSLGTIKPTPWGLYSAILEQPEVRRYCLAYLDLIKLSNIPYGLCSRRSKDILHLTKNFILQG